MGCSKIYSSIACALLAASAGWCVAQGSSATQKNATRILPPAVEVSSPFAIDAPASQRADAVAFLSDDAMTARDRQDVRDAAPAIEKKAALRGFNLERGGWSYQQIACPVFPGHLLLLYSRNRGVGDVSQFSAIVPRDGNGSVRVLPILRRSYSLFTPAPVNPLTIAAFNTLRAHEHPDRKVDWLATGLCYAALTGSEVKLPRAANGAADQNMTGAMNAVLQVEEDGAAVVRFFDVEDPEQTRSWDLSFDKEGKLMRVAVTPVPELKPTMVP